MIQMPFQEENIKQNKIPKSRYFKDKDKFTIKIFQELNKKAHILLCQDYKRTRNNQANKFYLGCTRH